MIEISAEEEKKSNDCQTPEGKCGERAHGAASTQRLGPDGKSASHDFG